VSNALKHSGASRVRLRAARTEGGLSLCFADDGRGFEPNLIPPRALGLENIRYRITRIGGGVEILSAPGAGSRFDIVLPDPRRARPAAPEAAPAPEAVSEEGAR